MFKHILGLYLKKHKLFMISIIFLIVVVSVLAVLPAQILRVIVDDTIGSKNYSKLVILAVFYTLSYLLLGIINFLKDLVLVSTSQGFLAYLKIKMLEQVHRFKYQTLVTKDTGSLEAYFNNDTNSINELFTSGVIDMTTDLFKMLAILISIFIYSWVFGFIVLLIIPFILLFTAFVRKRMLKAQLKTKNLEGNVNQELLEIVENIVTIKTSKCSSYIKKRYQNVLNNHFKANQASNFYDAIFSPTMQIIRSVVVAVILLISGVNSSIFGMSIGMIISAISLLTDLFSPIENLGMEIQTIQKSLAAVKRINEFFAFPIDEVKTITSITGPLVLSYHNVSFSYDKKEVIKNFNLDILQNAKISLQGPSGSGKSTLMKLALGLIKPNRGEVLLNDKPTYLLNEEERQKLVQIVYQEPFFSAGTIYEELTLRDQTIKPEACYLALNLVGLSYIKDINVLLNPKEYSSGELALFNVARVIVHNPQIIFLDEMNAKIDPYTSNKIINIIDEFAKDKMVISINHYGKPLANAKIIKLTNC